MNRVARALALAGCLLPAAFLASPAAAQTAAGNFVDVKGGRLWYETCGSGPKTMVLIHDGLLHSVGWDDVWPELCKTFRVIRYDRRGYGRSPEAKAPYSQVDDLEAVMHVAGMDHAVIVGSSAGGGLAVDFTLAHPKAVDKLVVIGPDVTGFTNSDYFQTRAAELLAKRAQGDLEGALEGSWVLARGDHTNLKRLLALEKANPQDMNHQDPATPAPPAAPRLGEIKVPTLVLVGEDDVADNQAKAGALEYAIRGARRVVIRGAGHLVYMEQPAEFTRIVSGFADPTAAAKHASPGTEAALKRAMDEMRRGGPDYPSMAPPLAKITCTQQATISGLLARLGPLRSVTFDSVGPRGADVFIVTFDKGSTKARIRLGQDGLIDALLFEPPH